MGTVAYPALTDAEQIFKNLIWTPMVKSGEVLLAGAEASVPILNLSLFQGLEDDAIGAITDALFAWLVQTIDVTAIQLVNAEHQAAYDMAFEQLSVIADEEGTASSAYQEAQTAALAALAQFTHLGPA
jgi:hypothetical protein